MVMVIKNHQRGMNMILWPQKWNEENEETHDKMLFTAHNMHWSTDAEERFLTLGTLTYCLLINHVSLLVNGRWPDIWQCISPFTKRTLAQALSSEPASSGFYYTAMWFLLAAEILRVKKFSHEKSKICICSATGPNDSALSLNRIL